MSAILFYIFIAVVTLIVLIGFHEYGHFWIARLVGIKVLRFSIGFGKPLWRYCDKLGTEYVISAIPLGGYVKMLDEREAPVAEVDLPFAFNRQSITKRILVIAAGPVFNLLLAFGLFWISYTMGVMQVIPKIGQITPNSVAAYAGMHAGEQIITIDGHAVSGWPEITLRIIQRLGTLGEMQIITTTLSTAASLNIATHQYSLKLDHWTINNLNPQPIESLGIVPFRPLQPAKFIAVTAGQPAALAGLLPGDQVTAINGQTVIGWEDLIKKIKPAAGKKLQLTVLRGQQSLPITIVVGSKQTWYGKTYGYLGVQTLAAQWPISSINIRKYPFWHSEMPAIHEVIFFTQYNLVVLQKILTGVITLQSLGGPVSLFKGTFIAANHGLSAYLFFLAFISISLGIINLLPIPGLDGSHIVYLLIEAIRRGKPVSLRVQLLLLRLGMIVLTLLMIQAVVNDLLRLQQ